MTRIPTFHLLGQNDPLGRLANSQIRTILFWHLLSFLALSRSLSIYGTEYNLDILSSVLFWLQDLSIYSSDSRTNWSLVRNFQDCLSGREKSPSSPLHVSPMFFTEEKKLLESKEPIRTKGLQLATNQHLPVPTLNSVGSFPFGEFVFEGIFSPLLILLLLVGKFLLHWFYNSSSLALRLHFQICKTLPIAVIITMSHSLCPCH